MSRSIHLKSALSQWNPHSAWCPWIWAHSRNCLISSQRGQWDSAPPPVFPEASGKWCQALWTQHYYLHQSPPGMVTHCVSQSRAHSYTDCSGCYLFNHIVGTAVTWEAMLAWGSRSGRRSLASSWLPKSLYPSRKQNVSSMKYFEASALCHAILQHKYKINGILSVVV